MWSPSEFPGVMILLFQNKLIFPSSKFSYLELRRLKSLGQLFCFVALVALISYFILVFPIDSVQASFVRPRSQFAALIRDFARDFYLIRLCTRRFICMHLIFGMVDSYSFSFFCSVPGSIPSVALLHLSSEEMLKKQKEE
ncbi:hypothetical protein L484_021562 [Morus notabilis]|uniref:Uncharacterized protein n=1 Tax=Morus notabilis TaxID=981085 RepID=W9S0P4_9ROSA|nr:hypothetical protein L484_021562 [Morus notabilis]